MALKFFLLGVPRIERDGQPLNVSRRKTLACAVYLARTGQAQGREVLATLLWPEFDSGAALANLRRLLSRLKRELGESFVSANRQQVQINPTLLHASHSEEMIWIDANWFESLLASVSQHQHDSLQTCDECVSKLEEAAGLYVAEFMAGFSLPENSEFEEWRFFEQENLRQQFSNTLQILAKLYAANANYDLAIRYARRWLATDPLHEPSHQQLMQLYAWSGQHAAAVRQYRECARVLVQELGVPPDGVTEALYKKVQARQLTAPYSQHKTEGRTQNSNGGAVLPIGEAGDEEHVPAHLLTPPEREITQKLLKLVGRKSEWQSLISAWDMATRKGAYLVTITGEAGIGKSRMAGEFIEWARSQGIVTAYARSFASEGGLSYGPIRDWLNDRSFATSLDQLSDIWIQELSRLLPSLLEQRPQLEPPPPLTDSWQRQRLFDALCRAITVHGKPLLLVLDDLQWCDEDSLTWMHFLIRAVREQGKAEAPVMIVTTMRTGEAEPIDALQTLLAELQKEEGLDEVPLTALSREATRELAGLVSDTPLQAQELSAIYQHSDGNPLFVIESIRAGLDSGGKSSGSCGDNIKPFPVGQEQSVAIPEKIFTVVESRLDQLSTETREIANLAAVYSRDFSFDLIAQVAQQDEETLADSLDELCHRNILTEKQGRYDFSHDLLREVSYLRIGSTRRRIWHRRIAEAMEKLYQGRLDSVKVEVAAHLSRAHLHQQAITYYQQAAALAQGLGAYNEATNLLYRGLALIEKIDSAEVRAETELTLQLELSFLLRLTRGWASPEIWQALSRARALCQRLKRTEQLHNVLFGLTTFYFVRADIDNALDTANQLLMLGMSTGSDAVLMAAHFGIGLSLFLKGDLKASRKHLEQGLGHRQAQYKDSSPIYPFTTNNEVHTLVTLSHVLWLMGFPEQARSRAQEAIKIARDDHQPSSEIIASAYTSVLYQLDRNPERVAQYCEETMAGSAKHLFAYYEHWCSLLQAWLSVFREEAEIGAVELESRIESFKATGSRARLPYFLGLAAEVLIKEGDYANASNKLTEAFTLAEENQDHWWDAELHRLRGDLLLRQETTWEEVRVCYESAIEIAQRQQARSLELRATIDLYRLMRNQDQSEAIKQRLAELCQSIEEGRDSTEMLLAEKLLSG